MLATSLDSVWPSECRSRRWSQQRGRTHADKLHAEAVGNGVGLGETQELITGVAEVSDTSQGDSEALGRGDSLVEALGLVVVGVDILRTGVGLRSLGQTSQAHRDDAIRRRWVPSDELGVHAVGTRGEHNRLVLSGDNSGGVDKASCGVDSSSNTGDLRPQQRTSAAQCRNRSQRLR